jgi:hypothetical protein
MIQRIQSVYLLLAVLSLGAMFFFPLASFIGGDKDQLVYFVYELISKVPDSIPSVPFYFVYPILGITILTILLSLFAIVQFKNRGAQLKMIRGAILLILVMIGVFFFYCSPLLEEASGTLTEYEIGSYMPLVALMFLILANRGVIHDINLLRAADRLR